MSSAQGLPGTANLLLSLGYEGRRAEELVAMLVAEGIHTVVDVRLTPISRKPGLSKTKLAMALDAEGIRYEHLKALGNPRDNRTLFRARDKAGRARFAAVLSGAEAEQALDRVHTLVGLGCVALLCFERDHLTCHREMVADALRAQDERIVVRHL